MYDFEYEKAIKTVIEKVGKFKNPVIYVKGLKIVYSMITEKNRLFVSRDKNIIV